MSLSFDDITGDMAADAANITVTGDKLKRISELAVRQQELELAVAKVEQDLKDRKEALRRLQELDLPQAMDEAGVSEFKLLDGSKVTVKPFYGASIPKDRQNEAFTWLEEHGFGDIIKNDVTAKFGKCEADKANEALEALQAMGFDAEKKESVHASTLKAWLREQVESGATVPLDLFGAHVGRQTVIKKG